MHPDDDVTALDRLADQRDRQRREVVGKDRDDIDSQGRRLPSHRRIGIKQAGWRVHDQEAAGQVDLGHDRGDERDEYLLA